MTLLYYDPRFLDHETGGHPERAERLRQVVAHLEETGLAARCTSPTWQEVEQRQLIRLHSPSYLATMQAVAERGGGRPDPDTIVCPASMDVARLAAGAVCDAVRRVVSGEDRTALCLVRPPGHHALPGRAMGFCLLNNIAVAAQSALDDLGLDRVLIVDWDVHHGNGTQAMFYEIGQVGFFSAHRWPFYPGTGDVDETGSGDGLGTTRNLPVAFGTPRKEYLDQFRLALEELASRMRPQLVLVSAGFDSHRDDPIGSLGLEVEDFAALSDIVSSIAAADAQGRIVSTLEGGYNPPVLARCVEAHLDRLLSASK